MGTSIAGEVFRNGLASCHSSDSFNGSFSIVEVDSMGFMALKELATHESQITLALCFIVRKFTGPVYWLGIKLCLGLPN